MNPPWLLAKWTTGRSPARAMLRCIHLVGDPWCTGGTHVGAGVGIAAHGQERRLDVGVVLGHRATRPRGRHRHQTIVAASSCNASRRAEDHVGVAEEVHVAPTRSDRRRARPPAGGTHRRATRGRGRGGGGARRARRVGDRPASRRRNGTPPSTDPLSTMTMRCTSPSADCSTSVSSSSFRNRVVEKFTTTIAKRTQPSKGSILPGPGRPSIRAEVVTAEHPDLVEPHGEVASYHDRRPIRSWRQQAGGSRARRPRCARAASRRAGRGRRPSRRGRRRPSTRGGAGDRLRSSPAAVARRRRRRASASAPTTRPPPRGRRSPARSAPRRSPACAADGRRCRATVARRRARRGSR